MICKLLTLLVLWKTAFAAGQKLIEVNGYLLVQTHVNGKGPYLFLLDTGTTSTLVTPQLAREAGLVATSRTRLLGATAETLAQVVPAVQIGVGDAEAASEVLIDPLPAVRAIDSRVAGVIGQSFVAHFPCLIDYRHGRLWLGEEAVARSAGLPEKFVAKRSDGRVLVPASLSAGGTLQLALDSGAPALVLNCRAHCPAVQLQAERALETNAGQGRGREGVVASLAIHSFRIYRPRTIVLDSSPLAGGEDGLLPAAWFSAIYLGPGMWSVWRGRGRVVPHQIDERSRSRARTIPIRDWLAGSGRRKPGSASMKPESAISFATSRRTYWLSSVPASRTSAIRVSRPSTTEMMSSRS